MSEFKNSPIEDFDWDAFERGETAGDKTREELTKTYDESLNTVKDKEVTEGTVISINKREVVVNIGYKSDGIISINEFRYNPDLKVGDKVEVFSGIFAGYSGILQEINEDKKEVVILASTERRDIPIFVELKDVRLAE